MVYSVLSDCEHINDALVRRLPIPGGPPARHWSALWDRLCASLERGTPKTIRTNQGQIIEYDEMKAA
jgi:hypothetical protein